MLKNANVGFLGVLLVLLLLHSCEAQSLCYANETCKYTTQAILGRCPGMYCGRPMDSINTVSTTQKCTSCPRGSMSDGFVCQQCTNKLQPYHIFYLVFMFGVLLLSNVISVEVFSRKSLPRKAILHVCVCIEAIIASIVTVLTVSPTFDVRTCTVQTFGDFYS
jgi:hypothetical protein